MIDQSPAAGETAEKDSEVTLLVAVGSGDVEVPDITGKTPAEAEQALRAEKLTLGQASPQPVDPAEKISSQIPAAGEVVKEGTPVDIFFPEAGKATAAAVAARAAEAAGGGGAIVTARDRRRDAEAYAQKLSEAGLVPKTERAFNDAPVDTLFATEPEEGAEVEAGATVTLLVSAGSAAGGVRQRPRHPARRRRQRQEARPPSPTVTGRRRTRRSAPTARASRTCAATACWLAELDKLDARPKTLVQRRRVRRPRVGADAADVLAMGRVNGTDRDLCLAGSRATA